MSSPPPAGKDAVRAPKNVVVDMMTFAICDDEPLMARELARRLADFMRERSVTDYSVSSFSNGRALLEGAAGFDAVFLDIRMEQPDGMETARLLRGRGDHSLLVFVTVLKECVFDCFQVEAFDYLLKPVDGARFRRTMDRVLRRLEQRTAEGVAVRRGTGCEIVPFSDLVYCEVLGRKVYLHKRDGTVIDYYDRLEDLERRLDGRFFKCHRSYLVNLDWVRGCRGGQVLLSQGEPIPASRLRERELTQALLRRLRERGG